MKSYTISAILALALSFVSGCSNEEEVGHTDKRREQKVNCVSNLKQIGLAFRIWEIDHGDQYAFNVSTNAGGTMELCAVGKDGFDDNGYLHFKVMGGEDNLRIPSLLICPQDGSKKAATNWTSLGSENVTYRLRSGTNVSDANPRAILAVCPVDGNVLYCDGTVLDKDGKILKREDQ